jgi:hypothetical protein
MKTFMVIVAGIFVVALSASLALANPALLPKHEGYPMKNDGSPVNGQATANDPGQASLNGEKAALEAQPAVTPSTPNSTWLTRITNALQRGRVRDGSPKYRGPRSISSRR